MSKNHLVKRILTLFKKTHEKNAQGYPRDLERHYIITDKQLGVGSFAVVKECIHRQTKEHYALKIILKRVIKGKEHMLDSELDILKKVRHPNVISLHDMYESPEAVYIVTDLARGGELFEQLLSKGSYTEKDASVLVRQMLEGLSYLHQHDIVHRDMKPENLLFHTKDEDSKLMITDFGLSKILKHHDDVLQTACGSPGYVAPEILMQIGYGKPVDLWSVGVIMYMLLSGYTPFWGEKLFDNIISGVYEYDQEYWSGISDSAKNLIDRLLTKDPNQRITADEALKHPWITGTGSCSDTNLIPNVHKGMNSRQSLRTVITAMTLLRNWRGLAELGEDDDDDNDTSLAEDDGKHAHNATIRQLDV